MNFLHFVRSSLKFSPLRTYQYEQIASLKLSGKVLDLGGGEKASYLPLIKGKFKILSMNIDSKLKPSIVGDITKPLPLKNKEFDFVISFNTFEHIFDFDTALSETSRTLKKGGKFIFSVPFLHQIHGSPDDYWRYSASTLRKLLEKHGLKIEKTHILGIGLFCARYSLIYGAVPRLLRPLFAAEAWLIDNFFILLSSRYRKFYTDNYALGYFVYAEKR